MTYNDDSKPVGSMVVQFRLREADSFVRDRVVNGRTVVSVCQRDLLRYYSIMEEELLRVKFTRNESLAVVAALRSGIGRQYLENVSVLILPSVIDEALTMYEIPKRFGISGYDLVNKIRSLSMGQRMAVIDAFERMLDTEPEEEEIERVGLSR